MTLSIVRPKFRPAGSGGGGGGGYTGPGDIATFVAWYGFRAYSAAKCGTKCIRVVRASDSAQQDINSLATGALDAASLTSFLAATTGKLVTMYDQAGTNDLTQGTDANRPTISTNGPNSSYTGTYASASSILMRTGNFSAVSQPVLWQVVAKAVTPGTDQGIWMQDDASYTIGLVMDWMASGAAGAYGGASFNSGPLSSGNWHSIQLLANGASSVFNIENSETTGSVGTQGISVAPLTVGSEWSGLSGAKYFDGSIIEIGAVAGTVASGNRTSLNSNVHAAYGGW
jgi:hypothetical protein